MDFSEMTCFDTLDTERCLNSVERHRKALISELNDLCGWLKGTEYHADIDELTTALEEADTLLSDAWDKVTERQMQLERAESGSLLAFSV